MTGQVHYIHVFFSGRVQGVGFRYTTLQIARGYDVAGYVRNLHDGRVELEAEGDKPEVHAFLEAIQREMVDYIRNTQIAGDEHRPASFKGFVIR